LVAVVLVVVATIPTAQMVQTQFFHHSLQLVVVAVRNRNLLVRMAVQAVVLVVIPQEVPKQAVRQQAVKVQTVVNAVQPQSQAQVVAVKAQQVAMVVRLLAVLVVLVHHLQFQAQP
jgi:hypothetical protein